MPGPVYDKEKMLQALRWVNEQEKNGTTISARHDPEIHQQIIELQKRGTFPPSMFMLWQKILLITEAAEKERSRNTFRR